MTNQTFRPNPYVGPRAFQTGEKLFGRDYETHELLNLLVAQRIVLLHAPSGAGKSSLVQAGLVPRLRDEGFEVLPPVRVNLQAPEIELPGGFNRYAYSTLVNLEERLPAVQRRTPADLGCLSLVEYLRAEKDAGRVLVESEENASPNLALIFDQFEEILTIDPNDIEGKAAFFAQLSEVLRDRSVWALFSMREDFLAGLTPYLRPVPTHLANTYRLDFLDAEAAIQALREPAQLFGVEFKHDAAQALVDNLRRVQVQQPDGSVRDELGPAVEPLQLQVISYRLWESLSPQDQTIDLADIEKLGDVNRSLSEYYDIQVAEAAQASGASERAIRAWVADNLVTPTGIRGQVLMEPERSKGLDNNVIRRLVNAYLLRSEKRGGATWFELAHDRLIQPVRESNLAWFAANLSLLQKQAALWDTQGRLSGLLISGPDLKTIRAWAAEHAVELSPVDQQFLEACEKDAERLEQEHKLELTTRHAAEQARAARRLRQFVALLSVALIITILLGIFAANQSSIANSQSQTATVALGQVQSQQGVVVSALDTANQEKENAVNALMTATAALLQAEQQRAVADVKRGEVAVQATQSSILAATQQAAYLDNLATQQALKALLARPTPTPTSASVDAAVEAQRLAKASADLYGQSDLSLLLALHAERSAITTISRQALFSALENGLSRQGRSIGIQLDNGGPVRSLAFAPGNGQKLVAASGQTLLEWSLIDSLDALLAPPTLETRRNFPNGALERVFFDPAGRSVALLKTVQGQQVQAAAAEKVEGIDVSRFSGGVDWKSVAGQVSFAYTRSTDGATILDPNFADNWFGMKDAGIARGTYHYFRFNQDPTAQAQAFLDAVPFEPGDLPPALDLSDVSNVVSFQHPEEIASRVHTWLDAVEQATGKTPVLIVIPSQPEFEQFLSDPAFQRYPLWVLTFSEPDAQRTFANRRWLFWLYRDDFSLSGVNARVNLSRFNGTQADLLGLSYQGLVEDAMTGKVLYPIRASFAESSAAGSTLALRRADGTLEIVDLNTYQALVQPGALTFPGRQALLAVSSSGQTIAISTEGGLTLLNLGGWQANSASEKTASALAFSPDGVRAAYALADHSIVFLPISQVFKGGITVVPQFQAARPAQTPPLPAGVTALAFSADESMLAAGLEDGRIALVDPVNGKVLAIYTLTGNAITTLAFNPAANILAAGSSSGISLADLRPAALAKLACDLAGREMTPDELRQYGITQSGGVCASYQR
jgi:GH25 family lysozyme M1 (1,4-beta-N-acetylmuramidase)